MTSTYKWRASASNFGLERRLRRFLILQELIIVLLLWFISYQVFQESTEGPWYRNFRIDRGDAIAYPNSDPIHEFRSALGILSGDGWAYQRGGFDRWMVYKPGWAAALALLAFFCDRDLAHMQSTLSVILAGVGPAFYFVTRTLLRGPQARFAAFLATLLFVMYPLGRSWWFQSTMMTEGPTLLLALLFCGFAVFACGRRRWLWSHGFVLGLLAGAACLVRSQSRYAVAGALMIVFLASLRSFRMRIPFLTLLLVGFMCVAGPFYMKTSYHLGAPYMGASETSIYAVLHATKPGQAAGGGRVAPGEATSSADTVRILSKRAKNAALSNLAEPGRIVREATTHTHSYLFSGPAKFLHCDVSNPMFSSVAWLLLTLGIVVALGLRGVVAMVPIAFALCYLAPLYAFSWYNERYGIPISWLATPYLGCSMFAILEPDRAYACLRDAFHAVRRPSRSIRALKYALGSLLLRRRRTSQRPRMRWPHPIILSALVMWIAGSTVFWIWQDLRPLRQVDVATLLADSRTLTALTQAGLDVDDSLQGQIETAFEIDDPNGRISVGFVYMPHVVHPNDRPLNVSLWDERQIEVLIPRSETYTVFYFVSPWKIGGTWRESRYSVRGRLYEGFRHGDQVAIIHSEDPGEFYVEAVLPTRWAR